jgi:hypothetical protein
MPLVPGGPKSRFQVRVACQEYHWLAGKRTRLYSGADGRTTLLLEVTLFNLMEGFLAAKQVRTKLR